MKEIKKIIEEPVHGKKFYTKSNVIMLKRKLAEIYNMLHLEGLDKRKIIEIVSEFVKDNVSYKKSYFDCFTGKSKTFDYNNIKYRTAYGALVEGEAMCAGYAEALRILLGLYDIESYTILSKLPLERKKLLHYVVVAEANNGSGEYMILDPESKQYCEKNKIDYDSYMESCIYMIPNRIFTDNVLGKDGSGMLAEDYLKSSNVPRVTGTKKINELIRYIDKKTCIIEEKR